MKQEFFGFYDPTKEEIENSWKTGAFVFDANVLLNLYRYSDSTRKDFLTTITKLEDKLFMPYQVGLEFHSNRLTVIESLSNSYYNLHSAIKEIFEKNLKNQLNQFIRHPSIDIGSIQKLHDEFLKKMVAELEKQKKSHPDFITKDDVLNQLTDTYKGKVGKQHSKEELKKIFAEGKERYEQSIPPGYKDLEAKRKRGDQHIYGDLIIWKEIIAYAIKEKRHIVFVTDDRKEDWWTIENGKTVRPREELIKEFYDITGKRILVYNADSFLQFAKQRKLAIKIKETSISEVKEVRKVDETYLQLSDAFNSEAIRVATQAYNPASSSTADILKSDAFNTLGITINPTVSSLLDYLRTDAFKTATQINNPTSISMADVWRSASFGVTNPFHNTISSSLFDLLKSNPFKIMTPIYDPIPSSLVDIKNLDNAPEPSKTDKKVVKIQGDTIGNNEHNPNLPEVKKNITMKKK